MLLQGHCSNPACHRPYRLPNQPDQYAEAIALVQFADASTDYRIFSVCNACLPKLTKHIVQQTFVDILTYEAAERQASVTLTEAQKRAWNEKIIHFYIIAFGRTREDIDRALKA